MILPKVNDVVKQISGYKYYSSIDLKSFYNNFAVHKDTHLFLNFTWRNRQYTHNTAPFGLHFLVTHCHRVLSELLHDIPGVIIYLDDIIIASNNSKQHEQTVYEVLKRLYHANFTIGLEKCKLGRKENNLQIELA